MRLCRAFTLSLLACLIASLPALAQYSIDKIVFANAAPYTDAELLAVAGIQPKQLLSQNSLKNATQHLIDTGLFDDASVYQDGSGKARTVHIDLKPKPTAQLLAASFENLVWFTPEELTQGIHDAVPLFHGYASDAGNLPDLIQAALEQMLTAKGIVAKLSHATVEPTTQHPLRVVNFRVEQPVVRVAAVKLSLNGPEGVPAQLAPLLKPALTKANGRPVNEGLTGLTLQDQLLAPARDAGYVEAHLGPMERAVATTEHGIGVTYTGTLITGDAYKLSALSWTPTSSYSAADFTRDAKLHPGDLAAANALNQTAGAIRNTYLRLGDLDAYILIHPTLDPAAHTVAYTLEAVPGPTYHLHTVTANGLSPAARQAFVAAWIMKPGDPYSDLAVNDFLRKNLAQPAFHLYSMGFQAVGDPETHLVDLTLNFVAAGGQ